VSIDSHKCTDSANSGSKAKRSPGDIETAIKAVAHHDRQTTRSLAAKAGIPKTSILRHMKATPRLKARTSTVSPLLTDANKAARLAFAASFVRPVDDGTCRFVNMHDYVHVDEKWFFLTKIKRRYYVYDDEEVAVRACKSKSHITKVMFLAAVARPRNDHRARKIFDGKIGVWPFVEKVVAQRTSRNRPRGAVTLSPMSVNADVYSDMMLNEVVPAIQAKFPAACLSKGVKIQQDNASPHRCVTTALLQANGMDGISIANQPPNSPDYNVLDLGFFNSIQSLQHQKSTRTIEELIDAVESAFYELHFDTLSKTFLTLQKVMEKSLEMQGGNNYKLPHMHKDASIDDLLSYNVECDAVCYTSALVRLDQRLGEEARMEDQLNSSEQVLE